jgi:ribA/ribD-fused uncharacterized protein
MNVNDIRSNEELKKYIKENGNPEFLFFYGGTYSQWWRAPFEVDGKYYYTSEHWMMAKKAETFGDKDALSKIFTNESPSDVKAFGRKVKNFDPKVWAEVAFEHVVQGNVHKFTQNHHDHEQLISDGDKVLVEASPYDKIWGIGFNEFTAPHLSVDEWNGTNLLGYAIMEARKRIIDK